MNTNTDIFVSRVANTRVFLSSFAVAMVMEMVFTITPIIYFSLMLYVYLRIRIKMRIRVYSLLTVRIVATIVVSQDVNTGTFVTQDVNIA